MRKIPFKCIYAVLSRFWKCHKSRVFGANFWGQKFCWCFIFCFLQLCLSPIQCAYLECHLNAGVVAHTLSVHARCACTPHQSIPCSQLINLVSLGQPACCFSLTPFGNPAKFHSSGSITFSLRQQQGLEL